jgi:2-polyprenyl-6-methoxyphenol hydroxylase-like FAD-dependent oxidoreductase
MSDILGRRAVVVGAGIGGLSMAGALAKHFEQVEIFERDHLTASAAPRPGTPQDRHPHGLLAGGLQALGEIFPGFERILLELALSPLRSHMKSNLRGQMLASCRSGTSAYRCSVPRDR